MQVATVISGGTVWTPAGPVRTDVWMGDGRIVALPPPGAPPPAGAEVVPAEGCHVLPGAIDAHVHFREPGLSHKEDWEHGSAAAVAGGVTTVFDMPNVVPATVSAEDLAGKAAAIAGRSRAHFGLYGGLAAGRLAEVAGAAAAGAVGFKVFMGETTASLPTPDDGELLAGLRSAADLGLRVIAHAENSSLFIRDAGPGGLAGHGWARPSRAEAEAVARWCFLALQAGAPAAVAHVTSAGAAAAVRSAKAAGADVVGETCPHYLLLTEAECARLQALAKVNPPLRGEADVDALWAGVADGTLDTVGSDHAPHTPAEKRLDEGDGAVRAAAAGFAGVQNTVALLLGQASAGRLSVRRVVELCAEGPARAWGLWPRKGRIAAGADADVAVWRLGRDPLARQWSLHPDGPVLRLRGQGAALVATWVDGVLAFAHGAPVGEPVGRWLRGPAAR